MDVVVNDGVLKLKGEIDFDNVVDVWKKSLDLFPSLPTITIDLQHLTKSDSSCLALLVAWMRRAKTQKKEIIFLNMPLFLEHLSTVSGLNTLLSSRYKYE